MALVSSKDKKPSASTSEERRVFVFHVDSKDNFLGLHRLSLKLGPSEENTIVLVCCLQWTSTSCEPRFTLYSATDNP